MEPVCLSESLENTYKTTSHHNPENSTEFQVFILQVEAHVLLQAVPQGVQKLQVDLSLLARPEVKSQASQLQSRPLGKGLVRFSADLSSSSSPHKLPGLPSNRPRPLHSTFPIHHSETVVIIRRHTV